MNPERVGPHRLLESIARGPASVVSVAVDRAGRRVLFKQHEDDDALGELLVLGASHPGLSACLDAGRLPGDGRAYTVGEFVDGRPLGPDAGPLRGADLARTAAWLLATLEVVHDTLGLLHRDIKADNVLVERATGRPVLVDFGLAVPRDEARAPLSGTPRAMAPELFAGEPASVRSDLWAVGLLLAEAGLGEALLSSDDDPVAMAAERRAHPGLSPSQLDALGGGEVAELVERLLSPDPAARPVDAATALASLASLDADTLDAIGRARLAARVRAALTKRDPRAASIREAVARRATRVELAIDATAGDGGANAALRDVVAMAAAVPRPNERLAARLAAAELRAGSAGWDDVAATLAALAEHGPVACDVVGGDESVVRRLAAEPGVSVSAPPACTADDLRAVLTDALGDPRWLAERASDLAPTSFEELDAAVTALLTSGAVRWSSGAVTLDELALPPGWPSLDASDATLDADERDVVAVLAVLPGAASTASRLREALDRSVGGPLERLVARGLVERRRSSPDDLFVLVDARLRGVAIDLPHDARTRAALALAGDDAARDADGALRPDAAAAVARVLGDAASREPDPPALTDALVAAADTLRRVARLGPAVEALRRAIAGAPSDRRASIEVDLADVLLRAERYDELLALAADAAARDGREVPALVVRAARVSVLRGAPRDALERLDDALVARLADDDAVLALQVRSHALQLVGDLDASLADVREALRRQGSAPHRRTMVLLERAGALARRLGRPEEALRRYDECLAMARELGHEILTGTTLQGMSLALRDMGRRRRALDLLHDAAERLEQAGDLANLARVSNSLGASLRTLGDVDGARRHLARAVTLARRIGDVGVEAMAANNTGLVLAAQGRLDEADESFARSLALRTERGDRVGCAAVLLTRGPLRVGQGRVADARADLDAARDALGDLPAPAWRVEAELLAARLALADGDTAAAGAAASEARRLADERGLQREGVVATDLALRAGALDPSDVELPDEEAGAWTADLLTTRAVAREARGESECADADFARALGLLSDTPDGVVEARLLVERAAVDVARLEERLAHDAPDLGAVGDLVSRVPRDVDRARGLVASHGLAPLEARLEQVVERLSGLRHDGDVRGLAQLAERVRDLERLADVAKALNTERDTQRLLDLVIDSAIDLTGAARGFLILFDGRSEEIRCARNISESSIRDPEFQISHSVAREVVLTREPLRTDNAIDDPRLASAASISELKLLSILCVPLVFRDRALGAVYVDHPQVVGRFAEKHLAIVQGLAEQAAIALENTRLSEGLKTSNDELVASRAEVERLNEELSSRLERREAELEEVRESLDASRRALGLRFEYKNIVTCSASMHRVLDQLDHITDTDYPVIIQGESGTGKELIARAIHVNGHRGAHNILSINCAAIVEPLIEAELFGAVKGAFTGADRDRKGLFEQADGGTLFLDEIGEMSLAVQSRLLRVLQEGEFLPVGGRTVRRVDVRVICATHRDLSEMVADKSFREDLFYRLAVATVRLPPLRERPDDIGLLLAHFLERHGGRARAIEAEALALLRTYRWPGNVRQLENAAMNLLTFDRDGEVVTVEHARRLLSTMVDVSPGGPAEGAVLPENDPERGHRDRVTEFERRIVREALHDAGGNKAQAARLLGVQPRTLYKMLERLGL